MSRPPVQFYTDPVTGARYVLSNGQWRAVLEPLQTVPDPLRRLPSFGTAFGARDAPAPIQQQDNSPPGEPCPPPTAPSGPRPPSPHVASGSRAPVAIDPSLIHDEDERDSDIENVDPRTQTRTKARPAIKVAGSRRSTAPSKSKGKARALDEAPAKTRKRKTTSQAEGREVKRGRTEGVANYSKLDTHAMLRIAKARLPVGLIGWHEVEGEFRDFAVGEDRPPRSAKSLEAKFKQLVKMTKPTGDAECPPEVELAHEIEHLMNEKVSTRDLDDAEFADVLDNEDERDAIEISDDEDDDGSAPTSKSIKTKMEAAHLTRRAMPSDRPSRQSRASMATNWDQLAGSLNRSMDPTARAAREDERSARSIQATQLLALSNDVRDLRSQLREAEQRANRAEMELTISRMMPRGRDSSPHRSRRSTRRGSRRSPTPPQRVRRDRHYRDGGASTTWVTPSDEEQEIEQRGYESDIVHERYYTPPPRQSSSRHHDRSESPRPARPASPFRSAMSGLNQPLYDHHPLDNQYPATTSRRMATSPYRASTSQVQESATPSQHTQGTDVSVMVPRRKQDGADSHYGSASRE